MPAFRLTLRVPQSVEYGYTVMREKACSERWPPLLIQMLATRHGHVKSTPRLTDDLVSDRAQRRPFLTSTKRSIAGMRVVDVAGRSL